MAHRLTALIGRPRLLARVCRAAFSAQPLALGGATELALLPLDDDVLDALHRAHGTGQWRTHGLLTVSSTDLALFARIAHEGAVAAIETDYAAGGGRQAAAVWQGGQLVLGPVEMTRAEQVSRPQGMWPINAALKSLGFEARAPLDAFATFGLADCYSFEATRRVGRRLAR